MMMDKEEWRFKWKRKRDMSWYSVVIGTLRDPEVTNGSRRLGFQAGSP